MPVIPLPNMASPGQQQARSIPELGVQATGDAFGAGAAEATFRGQTQLMGNIADAARAESSMWNSAIRGATNIIGEQLQKDWKLEAEAELQALALGQEKRAEGLSASGDGASVRQALEGFDQDAEKLIGNTMVPFKANILREGVQKMRFQTERAAVGREVAAVKQKRIDNLNAIAEAGQVEVLRDPSKLGDVLARTTATIDGANLTAHQRSQALESNRKALYQIALESHVTKNNFGGAQELLRSDEAVAALGPLESLRAQQRVNKGAEEWAERQKAADRQRGLMDGLIPLDPTSSEDRKVVDESFAATDGPRLLTERDPNAATFITNVAQKYGVVPKGAVSILSAQTLNGSPEQRAFAYQTISQVEAVRPGAFTLSGVHARVREEAQDFQFMTTGIGGLGLDVETAIQRIDQRRTPEFAAHAEARKAAIADKRNGPLTAVNMEREMISALDDAWFSNPVVGNPRDRDVIVQVGQRALEDHYVRTGDVDMAKAAAIADVRRTYGVSRLSGDGTPRIVRNPIEQRYPAIDGSHAYVREQAAAVIKAETGQTVDPNTIFFQSVRGTEEALGRGGFQTGNPPPYGFYWRAAGPDGVVRDNTIPGKLFVPDIAGARTVATKAATGDRTARSRPGYYAPHNVIRRVLGAETLSESEASSAATIETADRARKAEAARKPVAADPAADASQDIMDLFGFGARAGGGSW